MNIKRHALGFLLAALLFAWLPSEGFAQEQPDRQGFTLEVHLGISNVQHSPEMGESTGGFGVAPLGLGLGGFITQDFALMARMTGASMFQMIEGSEEQMGINFYGIAGQYWPADQFMVSAGAGAAIYTPNIISTNLSDEQVEAVSRSGYGFSLRAGYSFGVWENHSLRASAEVLPTVFEDSFVLGSSVILEYQFY